MCARDGERTAGLHRSGEMRVIILKSRTVGVILAYRLCVFVGIIITSIKSRGYIAA